MKPVIATIRKPPAAFYRCPGERHPIPRSVHLARLSSGFPLCRECSHCDETGLGRPAIPVVERTAGDGDRRSGLLQTERGIRGRYLNQLTRRGISQFASTLAQLLWEQNPLPGQYCSKMPDRVTDKETGFPVETRVAGPRVLVGYDERPSSPDLAIGAVLGLRQAGCEVIDVGRVTLPVWSFAASHLKVNAALIVTGAGQEPSWNGCDVLGSSGLPLADSAIKRLRQFQNHPVVRFSRSAGSVRTENVVPEYLNSIKAEYHALRPFVVLCDNGLSHVRWLLEQTFQNLPCRLLFKEDGSAIETAGLSHDVEIRLSEDGLRCQVKDERGHAVADSLLHAWLTETLKNDLPPGSAPVFVSAQDSEQAAFFRGPHWRQAEHSGASGFYQTLLRLNAAGGIDREGAFWIGGRTPRCDALMTLAAILRALSWQDASLSMRIAEFECAHGNSIRRL